MSARTHSRIESEEALGRAGVERCEPGGRAELGAGGGFAAGEGRRPRQPDMLSQRPARELPAEVADEALALARVRRGLAGGELTGGVRDRLSDELIDELLAGARTQEEIVGPGGLLAELTKRLVERAMAGELPGQLGYEPHAEPPGGTGNARNGTTPKTLVTEHGAVRIDAARDRNGSFEPQIVKKGERRFEGFDDKIVAMYARGMTTRDIEAHLREIYGVAVGRDTISHVTAAVLEDAQGGRRGHWSSSTRSSTSTPWS